MSMTGITTNEHFNIGLGSDVFSLYDFNANFEKADNLIKSLQDKDGAHDELLNELNSTLETLKQNVTTLTQSNSTNINNISNNASKCVDLEERVDELETMTYCGLPNPATGAYGSFSNVKAGSFVQGNFCLLIFSGNVTGVVDFLLSDFGLDSSEKVSPLLPQNTLLATTEGINGKTLRVCAYPNGTAFQLNASEPDYFTLVIPLILA